MDRLLARRLERDEEFRSKMTKLAKDYIRLGEDALNFYAPVYDASHDIFQGFSRLSQRDLESLDRGEPKNYILPIAATQIITMTVSIAQSLFGESRSHRVTGRGPEDEDGAELMNQLLQWNDENIGIYDLGYMWVLDSLLYNKGVFYESFEPLYETTFDQVLVDDPEDLEEQVKLDAHGKPVIDPATGQPVTEMKPRKFARYIKRKKKVGGKNNLYIVGPYEWICDPVFPFYRLQEMRFTGHRKMVSWLELESRSRLSIDDDMYVDPKSVESVKKSSNFGIGASAITSTTTVAQSRTSYERTKTALTPLGVTADDKDGGVVEIYELWVRLIPADYGIEETYEPTIYKLLIANKEYILSVEMSTFAHDQFPYAVGEPRPSPHYQFSPSWMMQLIPLQHHVDFLKNRHQEAVANTIGNIFIAKTNKVDLRDFLDPDKESKIIAVKPEAGDTPLDDIIRQVQITDLTKNFESEMMKFIDFGNLVSGATMQMQGKTDTDASATGEQMALDMGKTRMASVARLLSVRALVPQTQRQVSNFQQFLDEEMWVRIRGDSMNLPKELIGAKSVKITRDTIQGKFDFIPHDGALPGIDARAIAAGTKIVETGLSVPSIFGGKPGDLDLRKLLYDLAKRAGLSVEKFIVPYGAPPPNSDGTPTPPPVAPGQLPDLGGPGPTPPAAPGATPGPEPADLGASMGLPPLDSAAPPQIRPQNA